MARSPESNFGDKFGDLVVASTMVRTYPKDLRRSAIKVDLPNFAVQVIKAGEGMRVSSMVLAMAAEQLAYRYPIRSTVRAAVEVVKATKVYKPD